MTKVNEKLDKTLRKSAKAVYKATDKFSKDLAATQGAELSDVTNAYLSDRLGKVYSYLKVIFEPTTEETNDEK